MKKQIPVKDDLHKFIKNLKSNGNYKKFDTLVSNYWLLFFFIASIAYLELIFRLYVLRGFSADYFFPFLFAFPAGAVLFLLIGLFPKKAVWLVTAAVSFLLSLIYAVQIIYYCIFHTPLSLYSVGGAGDAAQFSDIVVETVLKNALAVLLLFAPLAVLALRIGKPLFAPMKRITAAYVLMFSLASYSASIICVGLTGDDPSSQSTLYFKTSNPELSVAKLGLLTTVRQDLQRLLADYVRSSYAGEAAAVSSLKGESGSSSGLQNMGSGSSGKAPAPDTSEQAASAVNGNFNGTGGSAGSATGDAAGNAAGGASGGAANDAAGCASEVPATPMKPYNIMDIDFDKLLAASGKDENLYDMHKYFSSVKPTATNKYTGMFKGDNLILITAEAFSPYFITPELTPTLYKMSTGGFVFKNFYNPVWGVSTSDGEYVACTGLIPKSGVWSFMKSGANYMPFCLGNQFRKLEYTAKAYHNHTYTYYKRDVSHPNMGYEYKGYGNGLVVKKTWPESDLEMVNVTSGDFTPDKPFHIYYMTVSGHMNYSFTGNYISNKNRKYVEKLPYSEPSKAYIACNLELEFAMKALLEKLEALGIAEKTVIALSGDHYPYGLPRECIDELAGHKVDENFELYKSTFILWKKDMETVVVNKPCASLDRIPTLSNLFGLEYDSRLLMGTDILSDSPALVVFSNRSWITDRARFNSVTGKVEFFDGTKEDKPYVRSINKIVADKFKYSAKILETDYYGRILK